MKNPRTKGLRWHGEHNEDIAWIQYGHIELKKVDAVLTILRLNAGEELEVTIHDAEFALGKKAKAHLLVPITIEVDLPKKKFAAAEGHGISCKMTDGATGVLLTEDGAGIAISRKALDHLTPKSKSLILKVGEESLDLPLTPDVTAALKAIYAKKKLGKSDLKAIAKIAALPPQEPIETETAKPAPKKKAAAVKAKAKAKAKAKKKSTAR